MHEAEKIREAKYFLGRMRAESQNRQAFPFEFSAFLSAARSVLQYAHKEAISKTGGQAWYDRAITSAVVKHLKDQRNLDVHERPLAVPNDLKISLSSGVRLGDEVSATFSRPELNDPSPKPFRDPKPRDPTPIVRIPQDSIEYTFRVDGWSGKESAIELSEQYLTELEAIVADGQSLGFLSV